MLQEADDENPMFGDEVPPADEMGPIDEGKPGGRRNTPGRRAKARAAAVVYGDPFEAVKAQHEASVQQQQDSLADMSRRTEDAIAKENDSRVQQAKEQADREHEMQMEAMRHNNIIERLNTMKSIIPQQQHDQSAPDTPSLRWWNPDTKQFEYGTKFYSGPNGRGIV